MKKKFPNLKLTQAFRKQTEPLEPTGKERLWNSYATEVVEPAYRGTAKLRSGEVLNKPRNVKRKSAKNQDKADIEGSKVPCKDSQNRGARQLVKDERLKKHGVPQRIRKYSRRLPKPETPQNG